MNINLTFDSSVNSAPAGFVASINAVVQFFDSHFNNPITVNIDVGYGEINGSPLDAGALGESETFLNNYSYSALRNALIANASSPDQIAAINSLPATDPTPGGTGNYWTATAEAKGLGLMGASSQTDGFIGFSNTNAFTYNTTNGGSVAPGTYDFFGVAAHEITEVLGRALLVGGTVFTNHGNVNNSYEPLDLFHYASSTHNRTFSGNTPGYFSPDGGVTNLDNFNTNPNGDFGDWANSAGNDAFLAFSPSGAANPVSAADLREMNVLGYDIPPPPPKGFVGNFNNDGHSDLLWQAANGHPTEWLMNGTNVTTSQGLINPGTSWHVIAANGDFNADLNTDILWQNTDGAAAIWEMNGTSIVGGGILAINPGPAWHVIAAGNFNADTKSDILWQNADGAVAIWEMNGTSIIGGGVLSLNPGPAWHVVATGDFNNDGKSDILWQHTDGAAAIWEMNGTTIIGGGVVSLNPGPAWHIVGTADFNADGKSDIIWQNADGTPAIWEMNGTSPIGGGLLPNPGASFQLVGAGNYNASQPDLVFLNTATEQVQVYVLNGANFSSIQNVVTPAPSTSQPAASAATPLSSSPVLSQPDAFYASLAGSPGPLPPYGGETAGLPAKSLFAST
jgi:FG-GAP-like repeat